MKEIQASIKLLLPDNHNSSFQSKTNLSQPQKNSDSGPTIISLFLPIWQNLVILTLPKYIVPLNFIFL